VDGGQPLSRAEEHGVRGGGAAQGYPAASFASAKDPQGNRTVEENEAAVRRLLRGNPGRQAT